MTAHATANATEIIRTKDGYRPAYRGEVPADLKGERRVRFIREVNASLAATYEADRLFALDPLVRTWAECFGVKHA